MVQNLFSQPQLKSDETITFFPTAAHWDAPTASWKIPIHGWVYEPADSNVRRKAIEFAFSQKYGLTVSTEQKTTFASRVNLFLGDNERGKTVTVEVAGKHYKLPPTKANGHTRTVLTIPESDMKTGTTEGVLQFQAVLPPGDSRTFSGISFLVPDEGISVISDIDDTVKSSYVLNRKKLLSKTFLEEFQAVEGMSEHYRKLAAQGAQFHFLSSSPWHLYQPLSDFLTAENFPPASFHLKDFRFKDKTFLNLFKSGEKTKPEQIREIVRRYPKRKFILIGDSGEQDPEVYAQMISEFGDQILRCFIRNVNEASGKDERFSSIFRDVLSERWQLFRDPKELKVTLRQ
jgi:hypothetical protein